MIRILSLLAVLLLPSFGQAEPPVLFDSGESVDIKKRPIIPRTQSGSFSVVPGKEAGRAAPVSPDKILPVVTPELTFGIIKKRPVSFPNLKAPVCVIGSDDRSLAWLVNHHSQLTKIGTRCILVQAETPEDLERVARFAAGIPVLPSPGGELARYFRIKHYPVLISQQWIEQ